MKQLTERPKARSGLKTLAGLLPFLAPYSARIGAAGIALLIAASATLAIPYGFRQLIDIGFSAGSNAQAAQVNLYFIALFAVACVLAIATAARFYLEPSQRIYGGMQDAEVAALESFVARGGNVVAEFNTLEEPTAGTAAGDRLGALLGVRFDRWLGRWYGDLSGGDEIPAWMRARYERTYWKPWNFRGPGLVMFSDSDDRIVVIDSSEFTGRFPITLEVDDADDPLTRRVRSGQPYWYWISGVSPSDSGDVLAHFTLHVNDAAKQRMRAMGFATLPPAIVRHRGAGLRAYLAGDFADVGVAPPPLRRTRGMDWIGRVQAHSKKPGRQQRFFWRVTIPIWDGMLDEVRAQAR